jgi:hypothetical protein
MKQIDLKAAEYIRLRPQHDRLRRISDGLGTSKPDLQFFELVRLEVGMLLEPMQALHFAKLAYHWRQKKNPYISDLIALGCRQYGILPPPSLQCVIDEAADLRFNADPAGTAESLLNDNAINQAYMMMDLIYHGDTLAEAASKAAQWKRNAFKGLKQTKASVLQKYYVKNIVKTGRQDEYFSVWKRQESTGDDDGRREGWLKARQSLPTADYDLQGVRNR